MFGFFMNCLVYDILPLINSTLVTADTILRFTKKNPVPNR